MLVERPAPVDERQHEGRDAQVDDDGREDHGLRQRVGAALTAAGVPVTIVDARGLSHNQVNTQIGAPGDAVMTPAVTSFLTECFSNR